MIRTPARTGLLRPVSVTLGTIALAAAWAWLDMSNTDFRAGDAGGGRTTAGWFILGFPIVVGVGVLASMPFSLLARRTRPLVGWAVLLATFVPLIAIAFRDSTPAARLRTTFDLAPPAGTRIERVQQFDSFNNGIEISGVCGADAPFVDALIAAHGLRSADAIDELRHTLNNTSIPDCGRVFSGTELVISHDPARGLLYFRRRIGEDRR